MASSQSFLMQTVQKVCMQGFNRRKLARPMKDSKQMEHYLYVMSNTCS